MAIQRATASTNDVWMDSQSSSYSAARQGTGSISGSSSDATGPGVGQHKVSNYHCYESEFAFGFTAVAATQLLVSEFLDIRYSSFEGSVFRDYEIREFDFGATPDIPGDFRSNTALSGFPMLGVINEVAAGFTPYRPYVAGSKNLHDRILTGVTPLRTILSSSRHRLANTPTGAERSSVVFANYSDSGYRPKLVLKTLANSRLARRGSSSVQLSDGTHAAITWDGSNLILVHSVDGTTDTQIDQLDTGTSSGNVDVTTVGWQTMSLVADESDNLWFVYKAGNTPNSICVQPYVKTAGSYAWTTRTLRQIAMPAYTFSVNADVPINNLAVAWHKTSNNGHLMVIGSHRMGSGDLASTFFASLSCNNILNSTTGHVAQSGTDPYWMGLVGDEEVGTRPVNDTSNCMDIYGDGLSGYSITADTTMGLTNDVTTSYVSIAKYTLTTAGVISTIKPFARRLVATSKEVEPETKAKVLPLDGSRFAFCFAGEIRVYSTAGSYLGGADYKALSSFNAATTAACDYLYDRSSGKIWFYYIDAAVATRTLKRNGFSLTSYAFDVLGSETSISTTVGAASSTNPAIRLPRGKTNERKIRIDVANITSGGTHSTIVMTDTFNVAPLAPVLGNRMNFNASNPAIFTWTFSDINTADAQSAFQLQIIDASDASLDHDTGKVLSSISSYTLAAGILTNGKNYQWKVRVWDLNDVVSATYSSLGTFSTLSSAITTLTVPAADNPADALGSTYTISWNTTVITQSKFKVVVINTQTGLTVLNTGFIVSVATSYFLSGLEDGVQYRIEVTTRNAADTESSPGIRYITPAYIEPGKPTVTAIPGDSFIELSLGNPVGPQPLGPENGDFETDVAGWNATGGSVAQSVVRAHSGTGSALMTTSGSPTQTIARPLIANATPVVELDTYILSMWWYSVAGFANSRIAVDWYDAAKTYISSSSSLIPVGVATWEAVDDSFQAPAGAAFAIYGPTLASSPANGTQLWFDDVLFTTADLPLATSNDLYKSDTGLGEFKRIATVPPNGSYRDYAVKSGKVYDYYAEAVV